MVEGVKVEEVGPAVPRRRVRPSDMVGQGRDSQGNAVLNEGKRLLSVYRLQVN